MLLTTTALLMCRLGAYECQKGCKEPETWPDLGEEYKEASYLDYIKVDLEKYNSRDLVNDPT